jgi:hypothetical protein
MLGKLELSEKKKITLEGKNNNLKKKVLMFRSESREELLWFDRPPCINMDH